MLHHSPLLEINDLVSNQPLVTSSTSSPLFDSLDSFDHLRFTSHLPLPYPPKIVAESLQTHPALRALLSELPILIPTDRPRFLLLLY